MRKYESTGRLLRFLVAHPDYQDTIWAYLIAFESDIRNSDSFAELICIGGVEAAAELRIKSRRYWAPAA